MGQISEYNKRIAKNTFFLYIRMMLVMLVTLYTSRIILKALGIEDFGIYNVVGGIVSVLGLIQAVMASAISRFFMFELGRKNYIKLNQYFRLSIIIYAGIALIVFMLAETIGLWFLNNKLIIPEERMSAAHWVYQFSILSFIINMMSVPYNSIIIAHERMNIYAYLGVTEVIMKLFIAYILLVIAFDKLKIYAALYFGIVLIISSIYYLYSRKNYSESKFSWFWNKAMFREMMGYSVWSLFGSVAGVARNNGINILLGMFFNPVVNAARAISYQVNEAINQFSFNFFTAVRPQITKQFAAGENNGMMNLVFRSSRFSFYLIFIFALPIMLETPYILDLWLNITSGQSVLFTRLVVLTSVIDSMSYPLMTAINATGNIKYYQIVTGGLLIITLPIAYLFLKLGYPPESTMYVAMSISAMAQISRIVFMKIQQNMSIWSYFKEVIFIVMSVLILSSLTTFFIHRLLPYSNMRFIIVLAVSIASCIIFIYIIGITKVERKAINVLVLKILKKKPDVEGKI
jgi:O-antigen/teichoic acid export membrane protein